VSSIQPAPRGLFRFDIRPSFVNIAAWRAWAGCVKKRVGYKQSRQVLAVCGFERETKLNIVPAHDQPCPAALSFDRDLLNIGREAGKAGLAILKCGDILR